MTSCARVGNPRSLRRLPIGLPIGARVNNVNNLPTLVLTLNQDIGANSVAMFVPAMLYSIPSARLWHIRSVSQFRWLN